MKTSVPVNHFGSIVGGGGGLFLGVGESDWTENSNSGTGGSNDAALTALASSGIAVEGGPMVSVSIGLPGDAPLSGFDNFLIKAMGTVAGTASGAFVGGFVSGFASPAIGAPVGVATGIVVGAAAAEGTRELLQNAANEEAYAGHVRHVVR